MKLNIGETIKELRKERDITQEEFADIIGVSFSNWEISFEIGMKAVWLGQVSLVK